jgi:hypothetical protein
MGSALLPLFTKLKAYLLRPLLDAHIPSETWRRLHSIDCTVAGNMTNVRFGAAA